MDITIETAVVALVALVAAVAVLGIATGQVGDFTDFAGNQTDGANCQLAETQYENGMRDDIPPGCDESEFEPPSESEG